MSRRKNTPVKMGSKSPSNEVPTAEENNGSSSSEVAKLPKVVIDPSNDPNLDSDGNNESKESSEIAESVEDAEARKKVEDSIGELSISDDNGGKAVVNKSGKKGKNAATGKADKKKEAAGVGKSGKKGGKTTTDESGEECTTTKATPSPKFTKEPPKIVKMKQLKLADPNVDAYDNDADEALIRQIYKLPFDDMMEYQGHTDVLVDGEKRYLAESIKSNCLFMRDEKNRMRCQLRALNARIGRLRKQIEREEKADAQGIDRNMVPRSSKGIGKAFGPGK